MADLSREELRRQYDLAVAEYRFQVDLNWRRSEYFFVLNLGTLVAASTLFASHSVPRLLVASIFLVGLLLAVLSILANQSQTSYYHSARDLKKDLEKGLEIGEFALATTPGMGSRISRLGRVGTFLRIMLAAIALADLIGAGLIARQQWLKSSQQHTIVVLGRTPNLEETVVVARYGQVIATREPTATGRYRSLELEPGRYELWTASREACQKPLLVTDAPVQLATLTC